MFCPSEKEFNLETSLGERVADWFTPPSLPPVHPSGGTQYLQLIGFPPCYNMIINNVIISFIDSCSRCPICLDGSKNLFWLIELILSYLIKRSSLEERIGWEAELIWVGDGRLPATSKVSLLIRGVRFAAKANTEGSFASSALGAVLALVSVILRSAASVSSPLGLLSGWSRLFWT